MIQHFRNDTQYGHYFYYVTVCFTTPLIAVVFVYSCSEHGNDQRHLATCTFSETRRNQQPEEEDPFCPYPPNVAIDDFGNTAKPLDYTSYFVDDYLITLSDRRIDTIDFFRRYMAGFVISKHENSLSVCRTDDRVNSTDADANDAMCMMIGATPIVDNDPTFTDTLIRQRYINTSQCTIDGSQVTRMIHGIPILTYGDAVGCVYRDLSVDYVFESGSNRYPDCNNIGFNNQSFSFTIDSSTTTDVSTMTDSSFRVSGSVRQAAESIADFSSVYFGRVYAPISNTQITGATIYYNNQVCIAMFI